MWVVLETSFTVNTLRQFLFFSAFLARGDLQPRLCVPRSRHTDQDVVVGSAAHPPVGDNLKLDWF